MTTMRAKIGVDTGGTFTDFVLLDEQGLRVFKCLSTPEAPEQAILQGLAALQANLAEAHIVHGTTVATNAVLQRQGAKVAYVTNHGFADVLTIARQARQQLYQLCPEPEVPPVPAEFCFETSGRVNSSGEVIEPHLPADTEKLLQQLAAADVQAVCINMLFSWLNNEVETTLQQAISERFPKLFVCRSSAVLPEYREYERGMACWLNASVGPKLSGYLQRLQTGCAPAVVDVMQSSGMTISAATAAEHGVQLLLSGPAAGLIAAEKIGQLCGNTKLMTFDIGGTSTDVALIDGELRLSADGEVAGYPVAVPMMDMHTIGAGGGSVAWLDSGGALQVGPQSAGADPGPACYGQGGNQATLTDANVVLGRIPATAKLAGSLSIDKSAAEQAVASLAKTMNIAVDAAAQGIVSVANERMAQALRAISVQRGDDPKEFALFCFGGAGGLQVCALADALNMQSAILPIHAGVLSALGMLVAAPGRQRSQTINRLVNETTLDLLAASFAELRDAAVQELLQEGYSESQISQQITLDCRYQGQSFTLNCPWPSASSSADHSSISSTPEDWQSLLAEQFHSLHASRYGHQLSRPIEMVTLRLALKVTEQSLPLPRWRVVDDGIAEQHCQVLGEDQPVAIYRRDSLAVDQQLVGPALVVDHTSTLWLARGWSMQVDEYGNLLLNK